MARLEPATPRSQSECATNCATSRHTEFQKSESKYKIGSNTIKFFNIIANIFIPSLQIAFGNSLRMSGEGCFLFPCMRSFRLTFQLFEKNSLPYETYRSGKTWGKCSMG